MRESATPRVNKMIKKIAFFCGNNIDKQKPMHTAIAVWPEGKL